MQTYKIKFDPTNSAPALFADADLFVYESGIAADGVNLAVLVKPDNGAEIELKPGQRFRLPGGANAKTWAIRTVDPAAVIQAAFIIGSGEFDDSNTKNTFKLDGTFVNSVNVNNTKEAPVQVAVVNQSAGGPILPYNGSFYSRSYSGTGGTAGLQRPAGVQKLVDPAANINGVVLLKYLLNVATSASGVQMALLAKSSTPTSATDGDVLDITWVYSTVSSLMLKSDMAQGLLRIPPGKGLYYFTDQQVTVNTESILWQVL